MEEQRSRRGRQRAPVPQQDAATAPARILAADDDPAVRAALGEALALLGYAPVVVGDGAAALAAARAVPPDLIILDHVMPPVDGLAVLETLQADPRLAAIPVLFLTADPQAIPRLPGVAAVMGKPFRLNALEETLRAILRVRRARPSGPARARG